MRQTKELQKEKEKKRNAKRKERLGSADSQKITSREQNTQHQGPCTRPVFVSSSEP